MLRNTLALVAVLALAATSQAAMILQVSPATKLPDTASSNNLYSRTVSAVATAGETINSFADPVLTIQSGLGVHQVFQALTNGQTPTRQDQITGTPSLWSDTWQPYDTYFFPTAANSLKVGAGTITETKSGAGATLAQGSALGAPGTGFGTISTQGGGATYGFTVASGIPGTTVAFMQVVQQGSDANLLSLTLVNAAGGTAQASILIPAVPEPATFGLLGLALAGGFGFIRRR